jgi:DNA-binding MarR family transcriptional regulator
MPPSATEASQSGLDNSFLETLVGYHTRRASLSIIGVFMERMAEFELSVVDFSVLSLIAHNPGVTSRQLCAALAILPPNLVSLVASLDKRGLIERKPHPTDGRAIGLYLSRAGKTLMRKAEARVAQLELDATSRLSDDERTQLVDLLKRVYAVR